MPMSNFKPLFLLCVFNFTQGLATPSHQWQHIKTVLAKKENAQLLIIKNEIDIVLMLQSNNEIISIQNAPDKYITREYFIIDSSESFHEYELYFKPTYSVRFDYKPQIEIIDIQNIKEFVYYKQISNISRLWNKKDETSKQQALNFSEELYI
jgi:hypothetical protein